MMRMRRLQPVAVWCCAIVAVVGLCASQDASHPYPGVAYIDRVETTPRAWHAHVVQIDLTSPGLRFKVSAPAGSREVVRQSTLDFLKSEGAQIAINAHYFW